jgi:hypothetical protein
MQLEKHAIWVGVALLGGSAVVWGGFLIGWRADDTKGFAEQSIVTTIAQRGCGKYYLSIAESGFNYNPSDRSSVAFFPAYPILIRALWCVSGDGEASALATSAICRLGALILFAVYLRGRSPVKQRSSEVWTLLVVGLFPTTLFWHVAYSESLFLLLSIATLVAIQRQWHPVLVGVIVGLATGTRPVGVALIPLLVDYIARRGGPMSLLTPANLGAVAVSAWGVAAFAAQLAWSFGEPLAFVQTQEHWALREETSALRKVAGLISLEPFWSVYLPGSPCAWHHLNKGLPCYLSLPFFDPLIFATWIVLAVIGWRCSWLDRREIILVAGLLAIPYVTRSFEMCMVSHGRFAGLAFPGYIVLGHLLSRAHVVVAVLILAVFGTYLAIFAGEFAAGFTVN